MEINDIFREEEYSSYSNFANKNNLMIKEIDKDNLGRRFQIVNVPELTLEEKKEHLRALREYECFSIINRGKLWYDKLNEEQLIELKVWYQSWLDVTKTLIKPTIPSFLNK